MSESLRVPIKKEIWLWAIEESQQNKEDILKRFPRINKWISGKENPTFKQLEKISNFLRIPFGYMFLENPPEENIMAAEFRTINNKLPKISKNLKDTIMEMDKRRNWMSDYRKNLGWNKLSVISEFNKHKTNNINTNARLAKNLINLKEHWYETVRSLPDAFNLLRRKLEDAGILVMQSGIVGNKTRRKLDINEFRAFMLYDEVSPLIFINSNDTRAGKIFSLIHEYIHVLYEQEDIYLDTTETTIINEQDINRLTAEFLIPEKHLRLLWNIEQEPITQTKNLGEFFKVSSLALAIKLKDLTLINSTVLETIKNKSFSDFEKRGTRASKEISFYNVFKSRVGPVFTQAVIRSAEAGDLGYANAFRLLGIRGKTYDRLKEEVFPYE